MKKKTHAIGKNVIHKIGCKSEGGGKNNELA
jgi:hypothetical protein